MAPFGRFFRFLRGNRNAPTEIKSIAQTKTVKEKPVRPLPLPTKGRPKRKKPRLGRLSRAGRLILYEIKVNDGEITRHIYEDLQKLPLQDRVEVLKRMSGESYENYRAHVEHEAFSELPEDVKARLRLGKSTKNKDS